MKKKDTIVLILTLLLLFFFMSCEFPEETTPTPSPLPTPTPEPEPTEESTPYPDAKVQGDVWIVPEFQTVTKGDSFTLNIHVHSGTERLAAYGFDIIYDRRMLTVTAEDVTTGPVGFIAAMNISTQGVTEGVITVSGFDASGIEPGSDIDFLVIDFTTINGPYSVIDIVVNDLANPSGTQIGPVTPYDGIGCVVTIDEPTPEPTPTPELTPE